MSALRALWTDEAGFVITSELLIIQTILVIGVMTGLVALRDAMVQEVADVAAGIGSLDQGSVFAKTVGTGGQESAAMTRSNAAPGSISVSVPPAAAGAAR